MSNESRKNPLETIPIGTVIASKYRIDCLLGQGGMGAVLGATHLLLGQRVAIKVLRTEMVGVHDIAARFLREAQAAVRLHGEHVARVLDVGTLESGAPYIVMEYLEGHDLRAIVRARGPLPVGEAVGYVLQVLEAMAEAHTAGIVHRDLKPANLFVTSRPGSVATVKVLDFGISKHISEEEGSQQLTSTSAVFGSPLYMSPEQIRSSKNVDQRTDIWALGVILFELTTGDWPFRAETPAALCVAISLEPPRSMRELCPAIPPAFEQVVLRCLVKDPQQRLASVGDLAAALLPFATSPAAQNSVDNVLSISPPTVQSGLVNGETSPPVASGVSTQPQPRSSRVPWMVAAGVTAALMLTLGIGGLVLWRFSGPEPSPSPAVSIPPMASQQAPPAASSLAASDPQAPADSASASTSAATEPPATRNPVTASESKRKPAPTPRTSTQPPPKSTGNTAIDTRK